MRSQVGVRGLWYVGMEGFLNSGFRCRRLDFHGAKP